MNLNDLITERQRIKDERSALSAQDSALARQLDDIDQQLLALMDEQGTTSTAIQTDGARISVSISEQTVPTVTNWQAVYDYIERTGRFQLFERRMSSAAFREIIGLEGEVPGVQPFTRRTINMQRRVAS